MADPHIAKALQRKADFSAALLNFLRTSVTASLSVMLPVALETQNLTAVSVHFVFIFIIAGQKLDLIDLRPVICLQP